MITPDPPADGEDVQIFENGETGPQAAVRVPVPVEGSGRLQLSEREREVMTLVASGLQSSDIAGRLFLSPETVKSHVHNALGKLGAHTRAHAVAIALVTGQIVWDVQSLRDGTS